MKHPGNLLVILLLLFNFLTAQGQNTGNLPAGMHRAYVENGDTVVLAQIRTIYVYPPYKFKNAQEEKEYWRMVRDVKKTLPLAKIVYTTLIETYEFLQLLPDEKSRAEHLKRMEKELFQEYKPQLKKLSLRQGKLLIKLIDRECNQSSFELIRSFLGGFRAGFWQAFGRLFGANLKSGWDPQGKDAQLERICILVENGML